MDEEMLQVRGRDVNRMRINEAASRLPRCFERVFRFSKPLRQLRLFESPLASKRNSGPRWRVVGRERRLPRPSDRSVGISPPFRGPCLWANGPSNFALRHAGLLWRAQRVAPDFEESSAGAVQAVFAVRGISSDGRRSVPVFSSQTRRVGEDFERSYPFRCAFRAGYSK